MRALLFVFVTLQAFSALASERCYELSAESPTPLMLCVDDTRAPLASVTVRASGRTVASWQLRVLERVRCADCNRDVLGLEEVGADFLRIRFDGVRQLNAEAGTVVIGTTRFAYRTPGAPPPSGPPPMTPSAGAPPPQGMSPGAFQDLLTALDSQSWSVSGLESTVATAAKTNRFTAEQITQVLKHVPGRALQVNSARMLVPKVVDPSNLASVSALIQEDAAHFLPR